MSENNVIAASKVLSVSTSIEYLDFSSLFFTLNSSRFLQSLCWDLTNFVCVLCDTLIYPSRKAHFVLRCMPTGTVPTRPVPTRPECQLVPKNSSRKTRPEKTRPEKLSPYNSICVISVLIQIRLLSHLRINRKIQHTTSTKQPNGITLRPII